MDQALIDSEYIRRFHITRAISSSLEQFIEDKKIIKRGPFQRQVLKSLGLARTTFLCILINKKMIDYNFRLVTIRGYQYYKRTI